MVVQAPKPLLLAPRAWDFVLSQGPLLPVLVLVVGSCLHTLFGYSTVDLSGHAWGADDAYITYRYVDNLLNGHGLVFNPGEHVEGYSTLLYVLLLAALSLPFRRALYPLSVGVNLVCAVAFVVCFYHHVQRKWGRRNAVIAAFLLALCPPLWLAVASGMETTLVLFLQMLVWMCADRLVVAPRPATPYLLSASMVLLVLARADGFIMVFVALLYLAVNGRVRATLTCGLAVAALTSPAFLWRHAYYGYYFPNTYYAKVAGTLGERARYGSKELLLEMIMVGLFPYVMITSASLATALAGWRARRHWGRERIPFEAIATVAWLTYYVYIGGDSMGERFLLILFALGISAVIRGLHQELGTRAGRFILAILLVVQLAPFATDLRFHYTVEKYDRWRSLGVFLGTAYPGKSLAVDAAGKIPYFSGLYTIDMLGLADTFVAHLNAPFSLPGHSKFDPRYVLSRKPDLIAAFVEPHGGLSWGLRRELYERAGYKIRYLVNTNKLSAAQYGQSDIIDVRRWSAQRVSTLIASGYGYAVLERPEAETVLR
jgi:arabinofuranosyltransferase